jgi:N-acetylmuramoyl-L-alanine amidase
VAFFSTPPLDISDLPADAAHKGGTRAGYRFIIIHSTGGTNSRNWLTRTSTPPVSIHRLITKQGEIIKIVPDHEVAWHCGPAIVGPIPGGNFTLNNFSLGIELENLNTGRDPYPLSQVSAVAAQVLEWWGLYGAIPVLAHAWVDKRKHDPAGFPWNAFYERLFTYLGRVQ